MLAAGITTADWRSDAKPVLEEYLRLRESNGRDYALWKLQSHFETLAEMAEREIPQSQAGLTSWYKEHLGAELRERLIVDLARKENDAGDVVQKYLERKASGIAVAHIKDLAERWLTESTARSTAGEIATVLPGWEFVSTMIGGFNAGRLTQLLADTGFGKTNLGVHLAISAARKMHTIYVNMEMIPHDMTERIVVAKSGMSFSELNKASPVQRQAAAYDLEDLKLRITDGQELEATQIEGILRLEKSKHDLAFAVIDYDQKLILKTGRDVPEWQALQRAVVSLESLAKKLSIHIIILAQTNAEGAISGSRRSMFPASAVLRFYQDDEGRTLIEAVKNRFGKRSGAVEVQYDTSKAQIRELRIVEPTKKPPRVLRAQS